MAGYRDRHAELQALGFRLAALSVDPPDRSRALVEQLALPFPLLCDPGREVVAAYGLFNREEKGGIAYPATFVLDRTRTVRLRSLDRLASRVDLDGLFTFLRSGIDSPAPATPACASVRPGLREVGHVLANVIRYGIRSPKP